MLDDIESLRQILIGLYVLDSMLNWIVIGLFIYGFILFFISDPYSKKDDRRLLICVLSLISFGFINYVVYQSFVSLSEKRSMLTCMYPYVICESNAQEFEISDGDYQFLVYSILMNKDSVATSKQMKSIRKYLENGYISIEEFSKPLNMKSDFSLKEAESKLKLHVPAEISKTVLINMSKEKTNGK